MGFFFLIVENNFESCINKLFKIYTIFFENNLRKHIKIYKKFLKV